MAHVILVVLFLSVDMASEDLFDIVVVQECHHASIERILEDDFYKRESLSIGCCRGGDDATFGVFTAFMSEGLSFAAVEKSSGNVVGFAINYSVPTQASGTDSYEAYPRSVCCILSFIDELENGCTIFEERSLSRGLEICMLGVEEQYCGKGLAGRLARATISMCQEKNFQFIQSVPTCPATCNLFEKLGFKTQKELRHIEFEFQSKPGFPNANPEDFSRFVVKVL